MIKRLNTEDIKMEFIRKYMNNEFRILADGTKTVEIQNANFIADKDYILREPNYEYAAREIEWYESQSLSVHDIPGKVPAIWLNVADKDGIINSNYGWCIFSEENGSQYKNVLETLKNDPCSRQAIMIYNRPSMHTDAHKNGRHDFMCCQNVQYFLNKVSEHEDSYLLDCVVNIRSNDAVFGYNNDKIWIQYVLNNLARDLQNELNVNVIAGTIYWNAGSIHVYERHFKHLEVN